MIKWRQNKYMQYGEYEWDDDKNDINIQKHKIDFYTAIKAFEDPDALYIEDDECEICKAAISGSLV